MTNKKHRKKKNSKRIKSSPRVDSNGLTAQQRWISRWLDRNPNFGP